MDNFFPSPEYAKKIAKEILDNPEIKALLEDSKGKNMLRYNKPTASKEEVEEAFFKMWIDLFFIYRRYN